MAFLSACQSSDLGVSPNPQLAATPGEITRTPNPNGEVFGRGQVRVSLLVPKSAPGNGAIVASEVRNGALLAMKDDTRLCSVCFALTESDPCPLCADPRRSEDAICVVEEPADLLAIERARGFRGRYHVLHGTLAPLDGVGPDDLKIQPLLARLRDAPVREVILATNPTAEGEATALYLAKLLKPLGVKVTRLAHGLPVGADLEYADVMTVGRALEGRREM